MAPAGNAGTLRVGATPVTEQDTEVTATDVAVAVEVRSRVPVGIARTRAPGRKQAAKVLLVNAGLAADVTRAGPAVVAFSTDVGAPHGSERVGANAIARIIHR